MDETSINQRYDGEIRGASYKTIPDKKRIVKWYNKLESDTSRYQAIGNSLAIPCALRVIGGIVDYMAGKLWEKK